MREWALLAECRDNEDSLFFGDATEVRSERIKREFAAKELCAKCIVKTDCLQDAIDHQIEYGIWGGMTAGERSRFIYNDFNDVVPQRVPIPLDRVEEAVVVETRTADDGRIVCLRMLPTDDTWHGCKWLVCVNDEVMYHAYEEADAWLFFGTLVMG